MIRTIYALRRISNSEIQAFAPNIVVATPDNYFARRFINQERLRKAALSGLDRVVVVGAVEKMSGHSTAKVTIANVGLSQSVGGIGSTVGVHVLRRLSKMSTTISVVCPNVIGLISAKHMSVHTV